MKIILSILCLIIFLVFSCSKEQRILQPDISGNYSDTITIRRPDGTITDTVFTKEIFKINDSTFKMCSFLCDQSIKQCDTIILILQADNNIRISPQIINDCGTVSLTTSLYATAGTGLYDPTLDKISLTHSNLLYVGHVVPLNGIIGLPGYSKERMKKL